MLEILIELVFTPNKIWGGTVLGFILAVLQWYLLPENFDKILIGSVLVFIGFSFGLFSYFNEFKKK